MVSHGATAAGDLRGAGSVLEAGRGDVTGEWCVGGTRNLLPSRRPFVPQGMIDGEWQNHLAALSLVE